MRDLLKRSIWPTLFFALLFSALSAQGKDFARSKPSASFAVEVQVLGETDVETTLQVLVQSQEFRSFNLSVHNLSHSKIAESLDERGIDLSSGSAKRIFHVKKDGQPMNIIFEAYQYRNGRKIGATSRIRTTDMSFAAQQSQGEQPKKPLPKGTRF